MQRKTPSKRAAAAPRAKAAKAPARPAKAAPRAKLDMGTLAKEVQAIGERMHADSVLRPGLIAFRSGDEAGDGFVLSAGEAGAATQPGEPDAQPLLEIIGSPDRIQAILSGRRDGRALFFLGGIRVRGDMNYLSELGMKLGFLRTPIL
jgi:hypothetical protein